MEIDYRSLEIRIALSMGHQIIKQPNGKYAIWSTVVDNFILYDAEPNDIIGMMVDEQTTRIRNDVESVIKKIEEGKKPYFQFTHTLDECLNIVERVHSKKEANKLRKEMKNVLTT